MKEGATMHRKRCRRVFLMDPHMFGSQGSALRVPATQLKGGDKNVVPAF